MRTLLTVSAILLLGLSPQMAQASDMSGLILLVSVPIALVTFLVCLAFAFKAKTKDMMLAIVLLNLPNWLFCFKTFSVGVEANHGSDMLVFMIIVVVTVLSSLVPFWVLSRRFKKIGQSV